MVSPADDANRFAQALLYLLDRPAERARMGREGRITAVTRYAWSSVAAQLEHLYDELLGAQAGIEMRKRAVRPALRRRIRARDRRRRRRRARGRHGARGLGRLVDLRPRLHARPDLGLGLVHAELPALRPRRHRAAARNDRVLALTFDDGPSSEWTPRVLDALRDERGARDVLRARPARRGAPRARAADQRRGPRDRIPRLRPRAADVRLAGRRRAISWSARSDRSTARSASSRAAPVPRAARLPQPVRRARDGAPRLRGRRLDEGRLGHRQAGRRGDRAAHDAAASGRAASCCCTTPTAAATATTAARPPRPCPRSSSARTPPATSS